MCWSFLCGQIILELRNERGWLERQVSLEEERKTMFETEGAHSLVMKVLQYNNSIRWQRGERDYWM